MHKSSVIFGCLLLASTLLAGHAVAAELTLLPANDLAQAPARSDAAAVSLQPFVSRDDKLRLIGEDDAKRTGFRLSAADARQGGKLRIAYRNAVSVLPDNGVLDVEVNGAAIGAIPIRSPSGLQAVDLAVDGRTLHEGWNEVRLHARQHHRVDCSLNAVYELWTDIDTAASGFVKAEANAFAAPEDLLSVGRVADGVTDLRLVLPAADRAAHLSEALPAVETLALYLDRPDLKVSVADRPGEGPGIDVVVSGQSEPGAYAGALGERLAAAPLGLSVQPGFVPGRALVLVKAASSRALAMGLADAVAGPLAAGFNDGIRAERRSLQSDDRFTLRDMGYRSTPFVGRLFRTAFDLDMPADYYPGDYGSIGFKLNAAVAPGLLPQAQLVIRVNGRAVMSHRLYFPDGGRFDGKQLQLPLRAFHAGRNQVEILAELPSADDDRCGNADAGKPRFILLDNSSFEMPELARVKRSPDLAAFAAGAFPFGDGAPFDLAVDSDDDATLGAALTVIARLSLAARKPLPAALRLGGDGPGKFANRLEFLSGQADTAARRQARLAPSASQADGVLVASNEPMLPQSLDGQDGNSELLLRAFEADTALEQDKLSWKSSLLKFVNGASVAMDRWLRYQDPSAEPEVPVDALVDVSQGTLAEGGVRTVLSAGSPAALEAGIRQLTDVAAWNQLAGGHAVLEDRTGRVVTFAADAYSFVSIDDFSLSNLRHIGAAWLSDRLWIYVAAVALLIGGFAAWLGLSISKMKDDAR